LGTQIKTHIQVGVGYCGKGRTTRALKAQTLHKSRYTVAAFRKGLLQRALSWDLMAETVPCFLLHTFI